MKYQKKCFGQPGGIGKNVILFCINVSVFHSNKIVLFRECTMAFDI